MRPRLLVGDVRERSPSKVRSRSRLGREQVGRRKLLLLFTITDLTDLTDLEEERRTPPKAPNTTHAWAFHIRTRVEGRLSR